MLKRRLNFRRLLVIAVPAVVIGGGVHVLHGFQMKRSETLLLTQADRAENQGDPDKFEKYLKRYLGYEPENSEALARYSLFLSKQAKSPQDHLKVFLGLEQVLRLDPDRRDVRRKAIEVAMNPPLRRFSDARAHLEVLLGRKTPEAQGSRKSSPEDGELEELFGQCAEGEQKYEEAAQWYAAAVAHAPTQVYNHVRYASLLRLRLNKADEADRVMDARVDKDGIVALNPDSFRAYVERGRYRRTFQIEGARQDATRAMELAPDELDVLLLAAEVAIDAKDYEAARGHLRRGLEKGPQDSRFYDLLARAESEAGQFQEAEAVLNRGIKALPEDGEVRARLLLRLGVLYIDQKKYVDVRKLIEGEMTQAKIRPEIRQYLDAQILVKEKRWLEASRELEQIRPLLLADQPELAYEVDLLLGRCFEKLEETDRRYAAYQQAVAFDPLSVPARLGLADTLAAMGRTDQAIETYQQIVDQSPQAGTSLARLQIVRNLRLPEPQRNWAEVDKTLDEAAKGKPDAVEVPVLRATVLTARGQRAAAREMLVQARDRQPERVELWTALADLEGMQGVGPATAVLDQAQKALGDRVELRLARARWRADRDDEARSTLAKLAENTEAFSAEDRQRLLQGLAEAHRQIGDLAGTRRILEEQIKLRPDDLLPRLALFDLALQNGDEPAMTSVLNEIKAIETKGGAEDGTAWRFSRARFLMWRTTQSKQGAIDRNALEEARRLLTEAGTRRPSWSAVPLALGEIDDLLGNADGAIPSYLRAIELGDHRTSVARRTVDLLVARLRYKDASGVIARYEEDDPELGDDRAFQRLAVAVALKTDEPARAETLAKKAVPADSKDYHDLLWLGRILWEAGKRDEAGPVFRHALDQAGGAADAWVVWVQYLASTGQTVQAVAAIEEARAKLPKEQQSLALVRCYAAVGRLDQARAEYQAALKAHPDDATTLRVAANLELTRGEIPVAEQLLKKLVSLEAKSPDEAAWARRLLAMVLAARGNTQQAREALKLVGLNEEGSQIQPAVAVSDSDTRAQAKVLAMQKGRSSRLAAIRLLEQAAGRGTLPAIDRFLLAQLYAAERDWGKYRAQMQGLLAEHGENPLYLAHYIRALLDQKNADEASSWLEKLEQRQPDTFETTELKARVLTARGQADAAVALLKAYAQSKQDRLGNIAILLDALGQTAPAEESYRQLVTLTKSPESILMLAGFLARQNRLPEALDLCDQAWEKGPVELVSNATVRVLSAASAFETAQGERVAHRIEAAIKQAPDKITLQFDLANVRILQGRHEEAEAINRRLYEQNKSASGPLNNVAWLLAVQGVRGDEAIQLVNRAIELDGARPDFLDTRGLAYLAKGQSNLAIKDLEDAAALNPLGEIYFHLARAYDQAKKRDEARAAFQKAESLELKMNDLHPIERLDYKRLQEELAGK